MGIHAFKGFLGVGQHASGSDLSVATVARSRFARFVDAEWSQSNEEEFDPTSGRSEPEEAFLGAFNSRISATLEGTVEGPIGFMLRSLLGAVSSAQQGGTTAYLHTYTLADVLAAQSRLTFEQKYGTYSTDAMLANGIVNAATYDFGQRGMVRWLIEALTANPSTAAASSPTLPAANVTRLSQYMHTVTFGGSSLPARRGNVAIRRALDEDDFTATSRARRDASYGELEATFEFEVQFPNFLHLRRFWGDAAAVGPGDVPGYFALNLKGEHPTNIVGGGSNKYRAEFDFPKAYITEVSTPLRSKDVILQTIRGRAIYDSVTGAAVTAKLMNTQTTS